MDKDFLREKIKLLTELLRGLYALFILIGSGAATLFVRKTFLTNSFDNNIMISGGIFEIIIFLLILNVYKRINQHINKLK